MKRTSARLLFIAAILVGVFTYAQTSSPQMGTGANGSPQTSEAPSNPNELGNSGIPDRDSNSSDKTNNSTKKKATGHDVKKMQHKKLDLNSKPKIDHYEPNKEGNQKIMEPKATPDQI